MIPRISIVTVNWNGKHHLESFFNSLRQLNHPRSKQEIIMVDNGSSDGSVEFVKKSFPEVKVIAAGANLGFCEGNNRGIYRAKGDYILLLNNDTVVDRELVNNMLRAFQKNPRAGAVGAKVLEWNDENPAYCKTNRISASWPKVDARTAKAFNFTDERPAGPIDYAPGCAMMVKRAIVKKFGAFDPGYFAYYEDADWAARMMRAGFEVIYEPKALVWHRFMASANMVASDYNARMMARNRLRFALKNFDYSYLPGFLVRYTPELLGHTLKGLWLGLLGNPMGGHHRSQARYMRQAVLWNLLNLPATFLAKRRNIGLLHRCSSYNQNLPLQEVPPGHLVQSPLMNVVIVPSISWYFPLHQRIHHFAKMFARAGASVLYIEPERHAPNGFPEKGVEVWYPEISFNPFQFATDAKHSPSTARSVSVLRGFLLRTGILRFYHRSRRFAEERLHLLTGGRSARGQYFEKFEAYSGARRKMVFYQTPYLTQFIPVFKKFGYKIIYDMVDEVSEFKESPSYFSEGEGYLLKNADLVLTTAKTLFERAKKFNRNVLMVPNGVEYEHFVSAREPKERPPDMPKPGRPVIGYYGAIWNWFDISLLEYLARKRPKYNFVLIGTLYEPHRRRIKHLRNVYYLGEKPYSVLPSYLAHFDVATVMFRKSKLTKSVNPVKVFEYLAGGKPVVSTVIPEIVGFPGVRVAATREKFLSAIDTSLREKPDLKAIDSFLKDKTWVSRFLRACKPLIRSKRALSEISETLKPTTTWKRAYTVPIRKPVDLSVSGPNSYSGQLFKLHNLTNGFSYRAEMAVEANRNRLKLDFCDGSNPANPLGFAVLKKGKNSVSFGMPYQLPSVLIILSSYSRHPPGRVEIRSITIYRGL